METIEVNTNANGDAQWSLVHRIPAPIDDECLTSPDQIEPGDHVMVHAMGTWYPATAIAIKARGVGRVEVEYTSGTRTVRRKVVRRTELVPGMCGYPKRTHSMEALAWANAVWAALAAYKAPSMTTIGHAAHPEGEPLAADPKPTFEHDEYLRVVSMSSEGAKAFLGVKVDPIDLGPADDDRYRKGARVYGFAMPSGVRELDGVTPDASRGV